MLRSSRSRLIQVWASDHNHRLLQFYRNKTSSLMRRRFHTPGLGTHTQKVLTTGMFESRKARVPGSLAPEMSNRKAKLDPRSGLLGCGPTGFLRRGMHCLRVRKTLAPRPPTEWSCTSVCVNMLESKIVPSKKGGAMSRYLRRSSLSSLIPITQY